MGHFIFILFFYYYLVWLWVLCFPSLLIRVLLWGGRFQGGQMNPLEGSSIQSQKSRDDALKRQFEEYERRHFVVENSVYLSMLGCEEA